MRVTAELVGLQDLRASLSSFSDRRWNAAIATALTRTAVNIRDGVRAEMTTVLDRPTPYTLRALKYVAATASRPVAAVGFDVAGITDERGSVIRYAELGVGETPASAYMQFQINGGSRAHKRFERGLQAAGALPAGWYATPGQGARLDAYGNMSRGQIIQILSQLGITLLAGSNRNASGEARKRIAAQRKAGGHFFVVKPGQRGKLKPGIYQREYFGRNITPVVAFVRAATYRRRLDFYGIAQRIYAERFASHFTDAVKASAARLAGATR